MFTTNQYQIAICVRLLMLAQLRNNPHNWTVGYYKRNIQLIRKQILLFLKSK